MKMFIKLYLVIIFNFLFILPSFTQKLVIWCDRDNDVKALESIRESVKKNLGVTLEIETQVVLRSKFLQANKSGSEPDIILSWHQDVGEFVKNDFLLEFQLSEEIKSKYYSISIDSFTYKNKIYGIPYSINTSVILYNKELISEVPKTWEDMLKIGKSKLVCNLGNFNNSFPLIGSQGGYIFKWNKGQYDITDIGLATSGAIEGIKFLTKMYDKGNGVIGGSFLEGTAPMILEYIYSLRELRDSLEIGVAELPTFKGKKSTPLVFTKGFMISKKSKNQKKAIDFILKYGAEFESQMAFFNESGLPPAHIKANEAARIIQDDIEIATNSALNGIPHPNVKAYNVVYNNDFISKCIFNSGNESVETIANDGVKKIKQEITSNLSRYE